MSESVFAVVVTHRRPDELTKSLDALSTQTERAKKYLDKVRGTEAEAALGSATIGADGVVKLLPSRGGGN